MEVGGTVLEICAQGWNLSKEKSICNSKKELKFAALPKSPIHRTQHRLVMVSMCAGCQSDEAEGQLAGPAETLLLSEELQPRQSHQNAQK